MESARTIGAHCGEEVKPLEASVAVLQLSAVASEEHSASPRSVAYAENVAFSERGTICRCSKRVVVRPEAIGRKVCYREAVPAGKPE